jgi:transcription antitermination factor NusG
LNVGRRVRLLRGALAGTQGILLRKKGRIRVVVSIELIARAVAVEVDLADIAPVN